MSYHYERWLRPDPNPPNDPHLDRRIAHSFTLEVDYGTVLRSASVVYSRRNVGYTADEDEQLKLYATLSEADVVHLVGSNDVLRLAVPTEARSYELHGLTLGSGAFAWQTIRDAADNATAIVYDDLSTHRSVCARLRSDPKPTGMTRVWMAQIPATSAVTQNRATPARGGRQAVARLRGLQPPNVAPDRGNCTFVSQHRPKHATLRRCTQEASASRSSAPWA